MRRGMIFHEFRHREIGTTAQCRTLQAELAQKLTLFLLSIYLRYGGELSHTQDMHVVYTYH